MKKQKLEDYYNKLFKGRLTHTLMTETPSEQQQPEAQPEQSSEPKPESKDTSLLDQAQKIADRIEAGNKQALEILNRQEALAAKQLLGGRADVQVKQRTPEDDLEEMANNAVKKYFG